MNDFRQASAGYKIRLIALIIFREDYPCTIRRIPSATLTGGVQSNASRVNEL